MERQTRQKAQSGQRQTAQRQTAKRKPQTKARVATKAKPNTQKQAKAPKKETTTRYILRTLIMIIVVLALMAGLFAIGLMIGFGTIGGHQATRIFSHETWQHIDLFFHSR